MRIAVISDVHNNMANLSKTLQFIKKENIKILLCCGDLGSKETLESLNKQFLGQIERVSGNLDKEMEIDGPDKKELIVNQKRIVFTHYPQEARRLAKSQKYDIVFYGHTHKPWQEKIGRTILVNPGNLEGTFYPASFAIYDSKTNGLELKILQDL